MHLHIMEQIIHIDEYWSVLKCICVYWYLVTVYWYVLACIRGICMYWSVLVRIHVLTCCTLYSKQYITIACGCSAPHACPCWGIRHEPRPADGPAAGGASMLLAPASPTTVPPFWGLLWLFFPSLHPPSHRPPFLCPSSRGPRWRRRIGGLGGWGAWRIAHCLSPCRPRNPPRAYRVSM